VTYDVLMKKPRTVSVPDYLWERVDAAVASGEYASVSAFVSEAIADKCGKSWELLFAEWDEELGPVSDEDREWARRMLSDDR